MAAQCVKFETEAGVIKMEMFPESAPESVRNFLNLAAIGAFDTTTFSRVVPGFVIQGGDLYTSDKLTAELAKERRERFPMSRAGSNIGGESFRWCVPTSRTARAQVSLFSSAMRRIWTGLLPLSGAL